MKLPLFYVKSGQLSFGGKPLFTNIEFQIARSDKITLVGRNGSGKTTIMKFIAGEQEFDKGEVYREPGITVGYLPQKVEFEPKETIYDHVLKGLNLLDEQVRETKIYMADIILEKLSLKGESLMVKASGGKQRRAALARALVADPDILLLDEPTNHLDISAILWLEEYLRGFRGGLLCISHDKAFLANISNKTFWLDRGGLRTLNKSFKYFEDWQEEMIEQERKELERLGKRLEVENNWLIYGVTARRKRNQMRLKNLHELRQKISQEKVSYNKFGEKINLDFGSEKKEASKLAFETDGLGHAYHDVSPPKVTMKSLTMRVIKGEKLGIMGKNGAGKTSFLKLLTGRLTPDKGTIKIGTNIEISYFDQNRESLDESKSLRETLCPNGGDMVALNNGRFIHVVAYLKNFLFDPKQADSKVASLSGGEANRLLLAKILANPGTMMILDEPTNDLDMDSLEVLLDTLEEYKGTLLLVSHDRDFIDRLVTRTIIFEPGGVIHDFIGGYKEVESFILKDDAKPVSGPKQITKEIVPEPKKSANKLSYNDARDLEILPNKIEDYLRQIGAMEAEISDPDLYSKNPSKFNEISKKLEQYKLELHKMEERWFEVLDKQEALKNS